PWGATLGRSPETAAPATSLGERRLSPAQRPSGQVLCSGPPWRPYKCPQCRWSFKKSSNLLSHRETYSGAKPYACELCGKAYSHQGTPQQHRRLCTS
ncbi:ZN358 protein, partial [Fregetta grallaria]|nr:ZN358 protein [Fregetta grallaria]